jgi:hypothetical protein
MHSARRRRAAAFGDRRGVHARGCCNDPEKSPILELLVIFFFVSSGHHASITLHVFVNSKIIWNKSFFCSYGFIISPPLLYYFN